MKSLEQVLREKEKQLVDLEHQIEILRNAGHILGAHVKSVDTNVNYKRISQPQMIRAVLLEYSRPLHVDELRTKIEQRFGLALKNSDITSIIYRAIRGGVLFRKEGVNIFGLIEWKERQKPHIKMRKAG